MKSNLSIYNFEVLDSKGELKSLADYNGKALLIVNIASLCGYTPQLSGLERLYKKNKARGFEILAFPSNQFLQEPKSNSEIVEFCSSKYQVSFPIFAKVIVNGSNADRLFLFLQKAKPGFLNTKIIKWNFTKFLCDLSGKPIKRYAPKDSIKSIQKDIDQIFS